MPIDSELTFKTWQRYAQVRDNGHTKFVTKADKCERFLAGDQWDPLDRAVLEAVRRPVLTINKILATMSNVMGEQINNRAEISFRPRSGAPASTAEVLTKVFKQISDNNQLDWKRSDMFADGVISSRGFLDVRLAMNDHMQGEVVIENLNRKNVLISSDADDYDPDKWDEVFVTKWLTADDIAVAHSEDDADLLRNRDNNSFPYGYDTIEMNRDRFGDPRTITYNDGADNSDVCRNIRVLERQHRVLSNQKHFLNPTTGDMRAVPDSFNRNQIAHFVSAYGFHVIPKLVRRIRWTVIADNVVLHDGWSPYKHFTVVPYFPYLRYGRTIGLVENLLGPQELLNKVTSQELSVVNTTANSGYKVKSGSLSNMSIAELEQKGAQTGLVIEVNGDPDKDVVKIAPNQVPQGLDRISYKAEESIKSISGVSDSMQGMDRADVAAKAIQAKRQAGSTNLVKPLDNLTRTDFILARNVLDLVQEFYTEERMMTITHDEITGDTETFAINQANPEPEEEGAEQPYQTILNDLTLGEYGVVVSSVPRRETLEDSQFEQAMSMREQGVMLPDDVVIDSSRLMNKKDIIKKMAGDTTSPEAVERRELDLRARRAEVAKLESESTVKTADAGLKQAKAQETTVKAQVLANTPITEPTGPEGNPELEMAQAEHEADMAEREFAHRQRMDMMEHARKKQETEAKLQLQERDQQQKRMDARIQATRDAATAAAKPPAGGQTANRSRLPTSKV